MSTQLGQIAKRAKLDRKVRFTSLAHLLTPEFLRDTWGKMNRRAAGGVDGVSAEQFERELGTQIEAICAQLKAGTYRAPPVRRVDIPKGPGKVGTRPLGIPTTADRLLQRAVARILEAVFEADFLDCSHGFRPGRNPHHALQALRLQIVTKKVMQVFEADIRSYFTRGRGPLPHKSEGEVCGIWAGAGRGEDSAYTFRALRGHHTAAIRAGKTRDFRVSGIQTCLRGRSVGAFRVDPTTQREELSEVPDSHTGVDLPASTLAKMGAADASDEDVARLLSVLRAASL